MASFVVLKAHPTESYKTSEARQRFVRFVADLLSAGQREFSPQLHNAHEELDLEWGVDSGNDWWVFFSRDDPTLVRIQHRYGAREALDPLCAWIAYRWRASIVQPKAVAV
jgi:hypothetical protein